jgi:hypothetical protein
MMTLKEYLKPDPSLLAPVSSPEFIPAVKRSRGSREINLHSKGSVRGFFDVNGFMTWYEAGGERKIGLHFKAMQGIVDLVEQPPAVTYVDEHDQNVGAQRRQHLHQTPDRVIVVPMVDDPRQVGLLLSRDFGGGRLRKLACFHDGRDLVAEMALHPKLIRVGDALLLEKIIAAADRQIIGGALSVLIDGSLCMSHVHAPFGFG